MDFRPVWPSTDREMAKFLFGDFIRDARVRKVDAHIERLWMELPEQSKRRLGCIAASAGTDVSPENHALLLGSLALIAQDEGTFEQEREFCETYLCVPWVCEAVAAYEVEMARPTKKLQRRREQTRLAVAKHREKQRAAESAKDQSRRLAEEARMEAVKSQQAIMIDGEGITLDDGSHIYRYMAACLSDGTVLAELDEPEGITTPQALLFVTSLPKHDADGVPYLGVFGYGLGYDMTKWLEQLRNKPLYDLFHSEDLKPKAKWKAISLMLIGKCLELTNHRAFRGEKKTKVWDILKGFQSTFVKALIDWSVGTKEEWDRIEAMKKKRGTFNPEEWEAVKGYCKDECRLGAELVETYIRAHVDAGIDLRGKYHGAGSTSDAFLQKMRAQDKRSTRECDCPELDGPLQMKSAFSRAFFGGRAEVSRLGIVRGPCWTSDIASAYPHVLFELPCVQHGKWRKVGSKGLRKALAACKLACVHFSMSLDPDYRYGVGESPARSRLLVSKTTGESELPRLDDDQAVKPPKRKKKKTVEPDPDDDVPELGRTSQERAVVMKVSGDPARMPWGPLPYRTSKGSIVFPAEHPGGWAWLNEFRAAEKQCAALRATEAWVLSGKCKCERPYRAIGEYYLLRLQWGKEGRGKVLKLGYNGCYGKFAQVIGNNPKYSCRVVAGHITATTRGRLFEGIGSATDSWNVVYGATDGLISTEHLKPPNPPENETTEPTHRIAPGKGWLGVWEVDRLQWEDKETKLKFDDDLFIVQPGWYFGLGRHGKARTRGTPIDIVYAYRESILEQWRKDPTRKPRGLPQQSVFHGVKSSIRKPTKDDPKYRRDRLYGRWSQVDRKINYVVSPKRSALEELDEGSYRLLSWALWAGFNAESAEYKKDPSFAQLDVINEEQPDYVEPLGKGVGDGE